MAKISAKPISAYQVKKISIAANNLKNILKNKLKNVVKQKEKKNVKILKSDPNVVINKNTRSSTLYNKSIGNRTETISCANLNTKKRRSSKMDLQMQNKNENSLPSDVVKDPKKLTIMKLEKYISISSDVRSSVLILQENDKVVLEGIGMVQCLIGNCRINGFELESHNQRKYPVYSIGPHYSILALPTQKFEKKTHIIKSIIENYGLKVDEVMKTIHSINNSKKNYAVIVFDKLDNTFLTKMEKIKSFHHNFGFGGLMSISEHSEKLLYGEDYLKVVQQWKYQCTKHSAPVMLVAGDRNTGKSSFNRYLINSTLSSFPQVAYLECDPGQTEFASPGCVSLTIIKTPILGPPFTNNATSEITCFLGFVSPSQHPHFYLSCVSFILKRYNRDFTSIPLVVNTMGWIEGKGLEMLCSIIDAVRPTMLVQLYDRKPKNLLPFSIKNRKLHVQRSEDEIEEPLAYENVEILIPFNSRKCNDGKMTAAFLRNLKLLSCLSIKSHHLLADHPVYTDQLLDAPIYCVPMLTLHLCHDTSKIFLPSSFDASVCSLSILSQEDLSDKTPDGKLRKTPICESEGLGIIHAVNHASRRIYLATNIDPAVLCKVNCLLTGAVKIPIEIVDEEDMRQVDRVGLNYQINVLGSTSHKSLRKFIPRKRN